MKINQKEQSEGFERKLYVGTGEVKVLAINPTVDELDALLGREPNDERQEIEYVKEGVEVKYVEDGEEQTETATRLFVDVWVQEVKSEAISKIRFMLTNFPAYNKDGTKQQYINQVGQTAWCNVDDEDSLGEWFTHFLQKDKNTKEVIKRIPKTFRPAMRGEADLYEFLSKWANLNVWDSTSEILVENNKKFWKGNMSELKPLITMLEDNTVLCQFGVKSQIKSDDEGNSETVEYQSVYTRAFASGSAMKDFNFHKRNNFEGLKDAKYAYDLKKFFENVFDEEYGFKDFTIKGYFTEYSPEMNVLNGESAVVEADSVSY